MFDWDEETKERTITVTFADDSDVTKEDVREAVSELFEDSDVESNTDSETRTFQRGYNG